MTVWIVGVDVGGSGARAGAKSRTGWIEADGPGAEASPEGAARAALGALTALAARLEPDAVRAVAVGSTGLATLAARPADLRARLVELFPRAAIVLAADAVTAHLGALEGRPGVTVAAGTGAIGLSQSEDGTIARVDGWGHLLGDVGSGSWIGRRGLSQALRAHDGRDPSGAALLERAVARYGPPETWPVQLYGREDRAAVLGSFAPSVTALAEDGDAAAGAITDAAARGLAETAVAALGRPGVPAEVALTGGVFASSRMFGAVAGLLGDRVRVHRALGSPLDGALLLGAMAETPGPRPLAGAGMILW